jgi:hypothetical protein
VNVSDGAWPETGSTTCEGSRLLIDAGAIDPASWMRIALHAPRLDRRFASSLRGSAGAVFGRMAAYGPFPPPRGIPRERIIRMPWRAMPVRRMPRRLASATPVRGPQLHAKRGTMQRRARAAVWPLLQLWLVLSGLVLGGPPGAP